MDRQIKVISTNRNKIKNITCKHPELINDDAISKVERAYYDIINLQNALYESRDIVRDLEKKLDEAKEKFNSMSQMFDIEYETSEKIITTHKSNLTINGDLVYQYKH